MHLMLFLLLILLFLPVIVVGTSLYMVVLSIGLWGKGLSFTAYDPLFARFWMSSIGTRPDPDTEALFFAVPGQPKPVVMLAFGPVLWAARVTGYRVGLYDYPTPEPEGIISGLMAGRTTFFDSTLAEYRDQVDQIVILGGGWDTRPYRTAREGQARVYEVDEGPIQAAKQKAVIEAGIDTASVRFAPANFNEESWLDALGRTDFDPGKRTFVMLEAVSYYLEPEGMEQTLKLVAEKLAPGSVIAFDYVAKDIVDGRAGLLWRFMVFEFEMLGEGWHFGIDLTEPAQGRLATYAEQVGLEVVRFQQAGSLYAFAILGKP